MIKETTYHTTQQEADEYGKAFKESWGWGYSARYWVAYTTDKECWACYASRYDSCD